MDFVYSEEQDMLAASARRYVRARCTLDARRATSALPEAFALAQWREFAEMGWLALPVAEALGGLGGGSVELALLMEELGRGLAHEGVADCAVLPGALLEEAARHGAGRALLDALLAGDALPTLAHLEGGGRNEYDLTVTTRARPHGDGWRLSGTKHLVRHGAAATHWLVTAQVGGSGGLSLFVVDAHHEGVTAQSYPLIDGSRGADVRFDAVSLGADALLLGPGVTGPALEAALDRTVLALSAAALGSMEVVMATTADYLKTRVQYGKPLAQFQALQHRMSEMFVETDQARAALWRAIAAVAADTPEEPPRRAVSAAKWLISRAGLFVTEQGIQLHGGIGTTEECVVGHHYRAMLAFDKRLGDADFHLDRSSDLLEETR